MGAVRRTGRGVRPQASLVGRLSEAQSQIASVMRGPCISLDRFLEPAMTNVMSHWNLNKIWLLSRYSVWLAYGGLIAAMALAFAVVSH